MYACLYVRNNAIYLNVIVIPSQSSNAPRYKRPLESKKPPAAQRTSRNLATCTARSREFRPRRDELINEALITTVNFYTSEHGVIIY